MLLRPYSKNSVMSATEPLSVIAWFWRVACLVAMVEVGDEDVDADADEGEGEGEGEVEDAEDERLLF
jgi:hypothetical protein